jgi:hypothetical protein
MTPAARWVAALGDRAWAPGMLTRGGVRIEAADLDTPGWMNKREPDLTDAATVGAMLGIVRGLYGDPLLYVGPWNAGWAVFIENDRIIGVSQCPTEAEAIVCAAEEWRRRNP